MKRIVAIGIVVSLASLLLADSTLARPSWCKHTRNATERAICANAYLGDLDEVLNTAYERARFDSPDSSSEIRREQRRWLGRRNLCGSDAGCIERRYTEQIQYLESYFGD